MDREKFQNITGQMTQRYVTGKAIEGASLDEIAAGIIDPVEKINYVTDAAKSTSSPAGQKPDNKPTNEPANNTSSSSGAIVLLILLALAIVSIVSTIINALH